VKIGQQEPKSVPAKSAIEWDENQGLRNISVWPRGGGLPGEVEEARESSLLTASNARQKRDYSWVCGKGDKGDWGDK